ncbi:NADH:flavin oxidoreductase [Microbacterium awajiense]|uniref:NADH:flavin oxidoreductase n=1 Tax=Microbacterium awajiense TaxID=415214 RepID=A0ABP7ASY8_9MICO
MSATRAMDPHQSAVLLDDADPSPLFTPFDLRGLHLANRFVMAPMTRNRSPGGVPGDDVVEYYRRRARHLGLIVTEGALIDHPSAGSDSAVPHLYGTEAREGWTRVVEAVHREGGRIVAQMWHLGGMRAPGRPPHPEAPVVTPSGIDGSGSRVGRPATAADIDAIIAAYARSARFAAAAGFDGIEVHGAHGYLLDQFLWSATNRRTDDYGGTPTQRARLSAEVVSALRDAVGPDFPILFRYSQWKATDYNARVAESPQTLDALLSPLVAAGVDAFHVSTRRYWLGAFEGDPRTLAGWTKSLTGLPTIALGSVGVTTSFGGEESGAQSLSIAPLIELFERGEFDLVGLGRAVLSDPGWPTKLRERRHGEIRQYQKGHESQGLR